MSSDRQLAYPQARRSPLVETVHGVDVPDPYRWLEDADSGETRAWTAAQNALTRQRLDGPRRHAIADRLRKLYDHPRTLSVIARRGRYFFVHNPGLLDQPLLCTWTAGAAAPRPLIDPGALSADGTTALTAYAPSPDGRRLAYALSRHGSDREVIHVIEADGSGRPLADSLDFVKFASLAWTKDGSGFYYLRFPEPGSVPAGDEQYFGRICFHRLGDRQEQDAPVFAHPVREVVPMVQVSAGGRWAIVTAHRGASDDSEIHLIDRRSGAARPLFTGFDAAYSFIEEDGRRLFFRTTKDAPLGRIVAIDPERPDEGALEIVAESSDRLSNAVMARGRLAVSYLHNASDRLRLFDLDGAPRGEIPLPGIGSLLTLDAEPDDDEVRFVYTSFTEPPAAWSCRLAALPTAPARWSPPGFAGGGRDPDGPEPFATTQIWYPSRDGTQVSMFLVHRRDIVPDGRRPILLSGYGGFNISRTPQYDPGYLPWLEAGGVFALANLRGGGEYGEAWHRAGMLERKQNVFDDFIAAAEHLVSAGWTAPPRIAIEGGSNGGLLVGAVMLQRPDLFGAVVCRVPVADMLRYHLFTVGRFWIPEYGSADDPAQFAYLIAYSPYHNVRAGVRYPPALIMTAESDDRVAPGMAKKFAARLQTDAAGGPFLIRIETRAGHGAGKPIAKVIDEDADILAFVMDAVSRPR